MNAFSSLMILVVFNFLWTFSTADVFCQFNQTCTLLCSFTPGDEVVIHWIQQTPAKAQAHSYYHNRDQLNLQDDKFRGRTSMFRDQLSRGNASLQLTNVQVHDEGSYQCYTSTIAGNKEFFLQLKVYAPVQRVNMTMVKGKLTCSSEDIYPEPDLTWEPEPGPSAPKPAKSRTSQQLYTISSSLNNPDSNLDYSCTVSTARSKKKTIFMKPDDVTPSASDTTVTCRHLDSSSTHLTWWFNHTQVILTRRIPEGPPQPTEEWQKFVKNVSETGSLTLTGLTSDQNGIYTCEVINTEGTYMKNTAVRISHGTQLIGGVVTGVVIFAAMGIFGIMFFILYRRKKLCFKERVPNKMSQSERENLNSIPQQTFRGS